MTRVLKAIAIEAAKVAAIFAAAVLLFALSDVLIGSALPGLTLCFVFCIIYGVRRRLRRRAS